MKNLLTTSPAILAALEPTVKLIRAEYFRQLNARYDKFCAQLIADGMDINKSFAFPMGNCSRQQYLERKEANEYANRYTKRTVAYCRRFDEPDVREFNHEAARASFEKIATEGARAAVDGYAFKLTAKVAATFSDRGEKIEQATYTGSRDPWGFSFVTVTIVDGHGVMTTQTWRTRMIINVSCLGKLFNQWPTRRVS